MTAKAEDILVGACMLSNRHHQSKYVPTRDNNVCRVGQTQQHPPPPRYPRHVKDIEMALISRFRSPFVLTSKNITTLKTSWSINEVSFIFCCDIGTKRRWKKNSNWILICGISGRPDIRLIKKNLDTGYPGVAGYRISGYFLLYTYRYRIRYSQLFFENNTYINALFTNTP